MAGASGWEGRRHSIVQVMDLLRQRYGWKLDNKLGEGGFNYVFREEIDGLPRAVKISKDPVEVDEHEWNALKMVRDLNGHPHLLQLVRFGTALGHVVTVWELADGTLESALQERLIDGRGPFSAQELLLWMEEAAEAIDFLNERGIYHRDINPRNLFLLHGHVKVGDFGLVKQMGLSTVSHSGVGTFGYLPPECYQGKLVDWVDVYALCATYVRLRTGRDPFGENVVEIIKRQERGEYEREGLSAAEIACLDELLQPGAGKRWRRRPARE
jgi:serine/threonine protein kinase